MKNPFLPPLFELGLNAPGATRVPIYEKALQSVPSVEHTSLVQHPDVLAGVLQALVGQVQLSTAAQDTPPATEDAYYLRVTGPLSVTLNDAMGQTTNTVSGTLTTLIPDVTYHGMSDNAHLFVLPMNESITMTLQSNGEPLEIELTAGISMTTTQAIRYQDLSLPAGSMALVPITSQSVQPLRYDANGDGTFETVVQPSAAVNGPQANDTEPPTLSITRTGALDASTVTINAADNEAGVKAVYYSLDGTTYQQYTEPITMNATQTPTTYAFADDNLANRSSLVTYQLARKVHLPLIQGRP